ncbi:MAG: metallophosphoesterase [Bacillota bacterium]
MNIKLISWPIILYLTTLCLFGYLYLQVRSVAVKKYIIPIEHLPASFEGFTILHISDFHSKIYGDHQEPLLKLVKKHKFDIIALTGDFVDKNKKLTSPAIDLINGLKQKPIFYVPGNHDWANNFELKGPLLSMGTQVLENAAAKYSIGKDYIWIIGVDDPYLGRDDLDTAQKNVDVSATRILLAHAPNIYQAAIRSAIDLVLVGHTHGGQIRLPYLGALLAPGQGLLPRLDYGLFATGSSQMVVNGGLGETFLPIRFDCRSEIVLITLTRAKR